jgi:ferredoxin
VFDASGRFAPEFVDGSEREVPCDMVIFAVGQVADVSFLGEQHGLEITERGTVAVDRQTLATSQPGIYAGGDLAFGPRIVIEAVADGRRAARSIDTHLTGREDEPSPIVLRRFDTFGYDHPFAAGDYERLDRGEIATVPVERRGRTTEVEVVYSDAEARREGARCLHCWINTIFDSRAMSGSECIQCGGCADVCPEDCIDLVSLLRFTPVEGDRQPLRLADGQPLALAGSPGAALIKDETTCIRCGLCARRCPVGCITMQGFYHGADAELLALCETRL